MGICRSLCHSFSFENMRFAVDGYAFSYQILQEDLLHRKFVTECCYFSILISHMLPWMNKFLFKSNNFLPRFMKRKIAVLRILSFEVNMNCILP